MTPDQMMELGKQMLTNCLSIPVMWYMLRDLKAGNKATQRSIVTVGRRLTELELKIAGDEGKHKLAHLATDFAGHKIECKSEMRAVDMRVVETERQLAVLWSRLGSSDDNERGCPS